MKVCAIVVTYNGARWIEKCLRSLLESSYPVHIYVIDNASQDETINVIREHFSNIQLIQSTVNLGFGRANNIGIKKALDEGAEFFFLLNQDAWITKDTIETLVGVVKRIPQLGIISPVHMNGEGSGLDYNFSLYLSPEKCSGFYSDLYCNSFSHGECMSSFYEMDFVNAAAWLVSKDCMLVVDGFSSLFDHYGEDEDFVNKAIFAGYKIGCCPHATIFHDREGRKSSFTPFTHTYFKKKQIYYNVLFSDPSQRFIFSKMIIYLFSAFGRMFFYFFSLNLKWSIGSLYESFIVIRSFYKANYFKRNRSKVLCL